MIKLDAKAEEAIDMYKKIIDIAIKEKDHITRRLSANTLRRRGSLL
jgi:bacterioferritin (cytochrome b1)